MNVSEARRIIAKIDYEYQPQIREIKWNTVYNTVSDMVNDLKKVHVFTKKEIANFPLYLYKGYEFINGFADQVQQGKELSAKQITQCKRLALEIKKAAMCADCFK